MGIRNRNSKNCNTIKDYQRVLVITPRHDYNGVHLQRETSHGSGGHADLGIVEDLQVAIPQ